MANLTAANREANIANTPKGGCSLCSPEHCEHLFALFALFALSENLHKRTDDLPGGGGVKQDARRPDSTPAGVEISHKARLMFSRPILAMGG